MESEFEQITTELADGVFTITLNRPDRLNAWTGTMASELHAALDRADADDEVRAVIFTGAGRASAPAPTSSAERDVHQARPRRRGHSAA